MNSKIIKSLKPEEKELNKKRIELDTLEEKLVEQELELASMSAEIRGFEAK